MALVLFPHPVSLSPISLAELCDVDGDLVIDLTSFFLSPYPSSTGLSFGVD